MSQSQICTPNHIAVEWAGVVGHALTQALRSQIDWKERAPKLFLPKTEVARLDIKQASRMMTPRIRSSIALEFVTPIDAAGDDPLDRPATVIGRLARRIDLLARWMGIEIDADWRALAELWNSLDYDTASLSRKKLDRISGRERREFRLGLVEGSIGIAGDLDPLWTLLVLGQVSHAGRGATAGLGRYVLG